MSKRFKVLSVVGALMLAVGLSGAGDRRDEQQPVKDVLPKAKAPKAIEAVRRQLQGSMVFRDPVTKELRAPEAGEHQALAGSGLAARAGAAPAVTAIRLPRGGEALGPQAVRLEFMMVTRDGRGRMAHQCSRPGHVVNAEARDEK